MDYDISLLWMFEFSNFEGRAKNSALSRDLKVSISVVEKYHNPLVVGESVSSTTKNFKLVISDFYDCRKEIDRNSHARI